MTHSISPIVAITPAQASQRGLPAVGLALDASGTGVALSLFPEPGTFLRGGGPPGATLLFEVYATDARIVDRDALERALAALASRGRRASGLGSRSTATSR